jgi:hypothetical protein
MVKAMPGILDNNQSAVFESSCEYQLKACSATRKKFGSEECLQTQPDFG